MDYQIEYPETKSLSLDWKNPRLAEFGIKKGSDNKEIFDILWEHMALEEIVYSIVAHGFFSTEPLICLREGNIVLEGNRRLAAVRIVLDPSLVKNKLDDEVLARIDNKIQQKLQKLPVIYVNDRQEAWRFIGFKHINGPTQWNSFAKAQYITQIKNDFDISLKEIAFQVGDTHKTVQKLYEGMKVIEQAESLKVYDREDVKRGRLFFSHLYTGLQYDGFRNFLQISDQNEETPTPVPEPNKEKLGELLIWLYGSKKGDIEPVIKSQNPDLRRLEKVVRDDEALASLRSGNTLEQSFELSRPKNKILEESLFAAQRNIQKAWTYVIEGYDGNEKLMEIMSKLADNADDLYEKMKSIRQEKNIGKRKRRSDNDAL